MFFIIIYNSINKIKTNNFLIIIVFFIFSGFFSYLSCRPAIHYFILNINFIIIIIYLFDFIKVNYKIFIIIWSFNLCFTLPDIAFFFNKNSTNQFANYKRKLNVFEINNFKNFVMISHSNASRMHLVLNKPIKYKYCGILMVSKSELIKLELSTKENPFFYIYNYVEQKNPDGLFINKEYLTFNLDSIVFKNLTLKQFLKNNNYYEFAYFSDDNLMIFKKGINNINELLNNFKISNDSFNNKFIGSYDSKYYDTIQKKSIISGWLMNAKTKQNPYVLVIKNQKDSIIGFTFNMVERNDVNTIMGGGLYSGFEFKIPKTNDNIFSIIAVEKNGKAYYLNNIKYNKALVK